MVEINFARRRPTACSTSPRRRDQAVGAPRGDDGGRPVVRLGAGVTYTRIVDELADLTPCLAMASRTIGSPQIRNRGTVGGNLGTASPAGDAHPPLLATRAVVELESVAGPRLVPIDEFFVGPKRSVLGPDELIRAVRIPVADGPQQFSKIGPRNAMVIATTSFALCVDRSEHRIGTGIGSAGPTPLRAARAEALSPRRSTGTTRGRSIPRWPPASVTSWRRRPARSTTCGAPRLPAPRARRAGAALPRVGLGVARRAAPMRLRLTVNGAPTRSTTSGAARACCTCCASGSSNGVRRTPASRASAARARSCWTTSWCAPAWWPPGRRTARRSSPSRGSPTETSSTPCNRRSSTPARCSAGSAPPA